MTRKTNKKKQGKNSFTARLSAAKALLATLVIGILSAFGLMRCLDERQASPIDPVVTHNAVHIKRVDVGKGKAADPTLVNEEKLLKEEAPKESQAEAPSQGEPAVEAKKDSAADETEGLSIEERFPLYGAAFQFHTQFKAEPKTEARVIGYARRGAAFRLSERISVEGCRNGWYEVAPGGLFACANQGIIVGKEPVTFAPSPPAPDANRPLPYRYAYVTTDDTPEYWRIPTDAEIEEVAALFAKSEAGDSDSAAVQLPSAPSAPGAAATPSAHGAPSAPALSPSVTKDTGEIAEAHEPDENASLPAQSAAGFPDYLHLRMVKGYYVSLDDAVEESERKYQRTVRGRFIPAERLALATVSDFEGFLISDPAILPQVIIVGSGVTMLRQKTENGPLENAEKVSRLSRFDYLGEMKRNNKTYIQVGDGLFVSSRVAAVVRPQALPEGLKPKERWIDIDLSEQTLTAYEGERPVFATVVSTGRDGFPTPTGEFRIYAKHVTVTMDDTEAGAEAYSIEDVPWVQYFKDSYALHGAFWHNRFGRVHSHGCVNLSPKDAKRLFAWTGPELHQGVHGRFATKDNPGTRVVIHE